MSYIYSRGKKGTYQYVGKDGKPVSMKTNIPAIAEKLKNAWDEKEEYAQSGQINPRMPWTECRDEDYDLYVGGHAEKSLVTLKAAVANFERLGNLPERIMAISRKNCETWQMFRLKEVAPQTVNTERGFLEGMMRRLQGRGYIKLNPFQDIAVPRFVVAEVQPMTSDQCQMFLHVFQEKYPDYDILGLFAHQTGMRLDEILHQRMEDIDFAGGWINVSPHEKSCICFQCDGSGWIGKAGVPRPVPMSPELSVALLGLFQKQKTGCIFKRAGRTVQTAFKKTHAIVGTPFKKAIIHIFRHTLATDMEEAGVKRSVRKAILGHAKTSSTDRYEHSSPAKIKEGYDKLLVWRHEQKTKIKTQTVEGLQVISAA